MSNAWDNPNIRIDKKTSMIAQVFAKLPPEIRDDVAQRRMSISAAVRLYRLAQRIAREEE